MHTEYFYLKFTPIYDAKQTKDQYALLQIMQLCYVLDSNLTTIAIDNIKRYKPHTWKILGGVGCME